MQSAPRSVLITGANRGLGLEFVKQFLALSPPPKYIFAACRSPDKATDLNELAKKNDGIKVVKYDASDFDCVKSVERCVSEVVGNDGLNLLINNAGIMINNTLDTIEAATMMDAYKVNCVAPLMLTKALLPLLKKASSKARGVLSYKNSMVANISGKYGSITENTGGNSWEVRASKAAFNMVTKNLSLDLVPQGVMVMLLHPGWVQTDLGGAKAPLDTPTSICDMMSVMAHATQKECGQFYDHKNNLIPW